MNKLVKLFYKDTEKVIVKIDTETAQKLRGGEENFDVDGGLVGYLNKQEQFVVITTPEINVICNGDFTKLVKDLQNLMLNKKASSEIIKTRVLNNVKFVEFPNIEWTLTMDENNKILAVSNVGKTILGYYTETNTRIK